jgi:nitrate reductase gamma subunit
MNKLARLLSWLSSTFHLSMTIFIFFSTTLISPEVSEHWLAEGRRERWANAATGLDSWSVMKLMGDMEGASGAQKERKIL